MVWVLFFFSSSRRNDSGPVILRKLSHPWVGATMGLSLTFSMILLILATFAAGWTTNSDTLYDSKISGYSWSQTTFILMCISSGFSFVILSVAIVLDNLTHLGYCVYISWAVIGLYIISGITWFIYVWKYFHEYHTDYNTGKCKNCS
ncbi:unnamed protein product [Caenorhabditis nigoni]